MTRLSLSSRKPSPPLLSASSARRAARGALLAALLVVPLAADAHDGDFSIDFAGPGTISTTGSDYTVIVTHDDQGLSLALGLDGFSLAYRSLGGQITSFDYTGTDAYAALPVQPPDPNTDTFFEIAFTATPPAVATHVSEVTPFLPYDWKLPPNSTKTLHHLTVFPDTNDVRDPVILEITDQVDSFAIDWVANGTLFPLALFHLHLSDLPPAQAFLPPAAKRRLRPRNRLLEGEFNGGEFGDFTVFTDTGFDSSVYSEFDADGSASSGSAQVELATPTDGATASLQSLCIKVYETVSYHTGGALNAINQARTGTIGVDVAWYDDVACTTPIGTSARIDATPGPAFDEVTQTVVAPAGAGGARVQCTAQVSDSNSTSYFATCDSLYLPEPSATASTLVTLATLAGLSGLSSRSRRGRFGRRSARG